MMLLIAKPTRFFINLAVASVISICGLHTVAAQTAFTAVVSAESQAREQWRTAMSQNLAVQEGCFHAAYPSLVWESVECTEGRPVVRPAPRPSAEGAGLDVTGSGHDFALGAKGLITAARGSFFKVTGVKSETGVGVASYGNGGRLGANEYTLQLNSNANATTSTCAGHSGCKVWQQFVYSPDAFVVGKAAVYIQYWMENWGKSACPSGWEHTGTSCVRNSASVVAPDFKITELADMSLEGQATPGGKDVITFYNGSEAYSVSTTDSVLHLGTVWTQAEFNIVGNGGGSRADFNNGAELFVLLRVIDGSTKAPSCLSNAGTTGETNNLTLGPCDPGVVGNDPAIEFVELN